MLTNVEEMLKACMYIRKVYVNEFYSYFKEENYSPNEIDILLFLHNNPNINTSMQLCVCLNVSKTLVSRSIDSLIKKKLLISKKDEKDKCSSVGGMRDVENENSCNGENRKEKCEKKETGEIDADA